MHNSLVLVFIHLFRKTNIRKILGDIFQADIEKTIKIAKSLNLCHEAIWQVLDFLYSEKEVCFPGFEISWIIFLLIMYWKMLKWN